MPISRRTAAAIGSLYARVFEDRRRSTRWSESTPKLESDSLYDFLYCRDYATWFCNRAKDLHFARRAKELIMGLLTGESLVHAPALPDDPDAWVQSCLEKLATDIILAVEESEANLGYARETSQTEGLIRCLELDGYSWSNGRLVSGEAEALDVQEAHGILRDLIASMEDGAKSTLLHHLQLSEDHFIEGRWDDSISNSRKWLEGVLAWISQQRQGPSRPPAEVRKFLTKIGLFTETEVKAQSAVYSLLSETGGHPHMAGDDQARLLRHLSLTLSEFALRRHNGVQDDGI